MRIRLVGRLGLEVDGRPARLPASRRARALLAWLALHPGSHPRAEVAAMFWPDVLDSSARTSLRGALAELRRALGPDADDVLSARRDSVELVRGPAVWVDTDALSELAAGGRWREALELDAGRLVQGRLLPEVDDEWVEADRDEHRRAVLLVLERAATTAEADGDLAVAVDAARRRVRLDPLSEQAGRELVRLQAAAGDRSGALATAAALADRLRRELHLTPGPETLELVARLRGGQQVPRQLPYGSGVGTDAIAVPRSPEGVLPSSPDPAATGTGALPSLTEGTNDPPAPVHVPLPPAVALHDEALVGRSAELAALDDVRRRSAHAGAQVVVVGGDAGIGKTSLTVAAARQAAAKGALVLHGRCDEEGLVPFGPWVEALAHTVAHLDDQAVARLVGDSGPDLSRLLPGLRRRSPDLAPPVPVEPDTERWRLFDAVSSVLGRLAAGAPVLVVLDDAHWADRSTLLLLRHLVRARQADPITVVLTCRDVELSADDPLHHLLADLHREHVLTRLALRGLTEPAVGEMVARRRGSAAHGFVRALYEETEGNPFFVEEILRNLPGRAGVGPQHLPEGFDVPQGVQDVVRRRLGRLPAPVRDTLMLAAVVGRDFELRQLERISDLPDDDLLGALDQAVTASVIEETGVGRYSFTHALIRSALYDSLTLTRRARLHGVVARALEGLSSLGDPRAAASRSGELAFHYLAAADPSVLERAVEFSRQAYAEAMAQLAYGEAAATAGRAVAALARAGRGGREMLGLLVDWGEALSRAGDIEAARQAFARTADLARELGDREALATAALGVAGPSWRTFGQVDEEAVTLLDEALTSLEPDEAVLRATLQARLAIKLYFARQPERVATLTREALDAAHALADPALLAAALEARLWASWHADGVADRLAAAAELLDLAETHDLPEQAALARRWRVVALMESGRMPEADAEAERHARTARDLRMPYELMYVAVFATARAILHGRLPDARRESAIVAEYGDLRGGADALQFIGVHAVTLAYEESLLRTGDEATGDPSADTAGATPPATATPAAATPPAARGERSSADALRLDAGRVAELVEPIRRFADGYPALTAWRTASALALADADRVTEALGELDRTWPPEEVLPFDAVWLPAVVLQALTALRLGLTDRCAHLYGVLRPYAGRAVVMGAGGAVWGTVNLHLGALAAATGRFDAGLEHLGAAVEELRAMGAVPALARAEQGRASLLVALAGASPP